MLIRGVNLPLIISSLIIIFILVVFPLIVSYRAEKKKEVDEWNRIKNYGNKINDQTRKKKN